uniref:Uncharacterized protein n=1 Tax=Panagrolaimus superbus TaxID=310955 RepID=A0A914XVZ0_9BILA
MNYGLIIYFSTFLYANCIYLKRYKRFKETAIHERECIIHCFENEIEAILKENNSHFFDYKRQTSDFISSANKIIASCHSCGDSPLILDVLRSTEEVFNSKEQDYKKVFELNKCAKTTVLEKGKIQDSENFKTIGEEANLDSTKTCQTLKEMEKELTQKMMEFCNDKNTAVIKALLVNIRYNITVDKNIAYSSIYECL